MHKQKWLQLAGGAVALMLVVAAVAWVVTPDLATPRPRAGTLSTAGAAQGLNRTSQAADEKPVSDGPIVIQPDKVDVSPPLRDIPAIEPVKAEETLIRWNEVELLPNSEIRGTDAVDPNLQTWQGPINMPSPSQNWEGINNVNGVLPPDTQGDVGPNHYIQWVNLAYAIYNKTGARLAGPTNGNTLWSGFGGDCETANDGDPITLYDHLADRWFMSQFVLNVGGTSYQCIAVSQTADPSGAWYRYSYTWPNNYLNDYPHFGLWPDAYYLTVNQFNQSGTAFTGAGVAAYERSKMLTGSTAQMIYWNLGTSYGGQLPADWEGTTQPPSGAPGLILEWDDATTDYLRIWQAVVNWATPSSSTLTLSYNLATTSLDSDLCTATRERCVPQPGTAPSLEAISDRLMHRVQYRNFGDHQALVGNHTVDAGSGRAGIHWFELRNTGGAWSIYQQGTYAPADGIHRWMGSIAMDANGNMALGYSVSSTSVYPGIRYVGRLATDTLGSLPQGETVMQAGGGSQTYSSAGRWGDYSAMQIDPSDDCTFWYTQEYYQTTSTASWQTRIGSFKFPTCSASPDFALSATPATQSICAGGSAAYTVNLGSIYGFGSAVALSASGVPSPATATFVPASVTPPGSSTLTIGNTGSVAAGSYTIGVTGASGSLTHSANVTLNVTTPLGAAPALTAPADGSTGGSTTPTFTWSAVTGATSYTLQVATDPAFSSLVINQSGLTATSYTPGSALASDTVYYWRVTAVNTCGNQVSSIYAFHTAATSCATYASTDVPKTINSSSGILSTLTVLEAYVITDANVTIGSLTHRNDDQLDIHLLGPDDTTVELSTDNGGSGNNYTNTVFDDEAATSITTGAAPFTGAYRPEGLLSAFDGKSSTGANAWRLRVVDDTGSIYNGTLSSWSLTLCRAAATADYSDLASSYGVAWHTGTGAVRLGAAGDWDADTGFAAGTDNSTDNGVTRTAFTTSTGGVNLTVTGSGAGYVTGWFDWNQDGDFSDNGEQVFTNQQVNAGSTVPVGFNTGVSVYGKTFNARFRAYTSAQTLGPDAAAAAFGGATDGEVEDYTWTFSPLAVDLASFSATATAEGVTLAWETVSEIDNAGFNVYRAAGGSVGDRPQQEWTRVNEALIPALTPGSAQGNVYTWTDATVAAGTTWYMLEDVDLNGVATRHEPVSVTVAEPNAVGLAGFGAATGAAGTALAGLGALALAAIAGVAMRRRW